MAEVVSELGNHSKSGGAVVVRITLSPSQKVVGPPTEMVGIAGNGATTTFIGFEA